MKRFVAVLLCLMMLLSLFSCETPAEKNDISTSDEADTPFDSGTKPPETDPGENSGVVHPEAKKAMEMYESAINGEICVFDEQLGEIELKNCRFASDNLKLDEYDMLNKAILDLDGDGLCEYVIQSPLKDHLVLRYHDGKVYCYSFDFKSLLIY